MRRPSSKSLIVVMISIFVFAVFVFLRYFSTIGEPSYVDIQSGIELMDGFKSYETLSSVRQRLSGEVKVDEGTLRHASNGSPYQTGFVFTSKLVAGSPVKIEFIFFNNRLMRVCRDPIQSMPVDSSSPYFRREQLKGTKMECFLDERLQKEHDLWISKHS